MMFRKISRPIYKVPLGSTDKFLEGLTFIILALIWLYVYYSYKSLSEVIPTHYDFYGKVNTISHKSKLWILPACITILYLFLTIISNYPQIFNYAEKITIKNARQQYTMATKIVRVLKLIIVLVFGVIVLFTVEHANNYDKVAFLPVALSVLFLALVVMFLALSWKRN